MNLKSSTRIRWVVIYIVFQLFFINGFSQTVYYVDNVNGNNTNNGTSLATPWKTIQKACNSAIPNSTVLIRGGTYRENVTVNVSGTAGNPITFKNYANEAVMLDGTGTSGDILLSIINKSYLRFEGIILQNFVKNNAVGVFVECTATGTMTSLSFRKLTVRNIGWTTNTSAIPGDNDNAQPFIVYGRGTTAQRAITGLVVDSCEFYNNIPGYSEVLSVDANVDGFTITNNRVHDNINIGIYAGGNYGECSVPALDHARNGLIERNICYRNTALYATSGGIYADGAHNVIIRGNISYENGYGIEVGAEENGTTENITVIDNLIFNNEDCGISVGGWTTETTGQVLNSTFRNNTLFKNDSHENGSGEFYITKASKCVFMNNVVFTSAQNTLLSLENISPQASNTFNYNVYYTPSGNASDINVNWRAKYFSAFSKYKTGTAQDANSLFISPGFVSATLPSPDLRVVSGSPCIDAGNPSTVILAGETDFNGQPRIINNRIDIGAYESGTGSGIVTSSENDISVLEASVFPNPARQHITIRTHDSYPEKTITLTNVHGEVLIRERTQQQEITLDVSKIKKGVYFIRVSAGEVQRVERVIITGQE